MLLEGKTAVVTGAGSGLGRAYAIELARNGAAVVVNDIDAAAAEATTGRILESGGRATAHVGSVADWRDAASMMERAVSTFGRLDGLVNNAGVLHAAEPWEEAESDLRRIVEINLLGTMYCGVHAMRRMRAGGGGAIVNVTSSTHLGAARVAAYGATKGAIASLTYSWAIDGQSIGVRVNAVSPLARTPMINNWSGNPEQQAARPSYATPAEVAPFVAFLLSDRSVPLTGVVARHDGRVIRELRPAAFSAEPTATADASTDELVIAFRREAGRVAG